MYVKITFMSLHTCYKCKDIHKIKFCKESIHFQDLHTFAKNVMQNHYTCIHINQSFVFCFILNQCYLTSINKTI